MKKLSDLVVYETTDAFRSLIISNDFKYHVGHAYINFSPFTTPKSETIAESLLRLVPETYMTIEDITKSCKMKKICRERVSELSNTAISHAVSSRPSTPHPLPYPVQERAYHNTVRHIDTCVPAPLALSDRTELRSVLSLLVTLVVMATIGYFVRGARYVAYIARADALPRHDRTPARVRTGWPDCRPRG